MAQFVGLRCGGSWWLQRSFLQCSQGKLRRGKAKCEWYSGVGSGASNRGAETLGDCRGGVAR